MSDRDEQASADRLRRRARRGVGPHGETANAAEASARSGSSPVLGNRRSRLSETAGGYFQAAIRPPAGEFASARGW